MSLKNPVTPPGIDHGTVRLVAQRLNHYATPCPFHIIKGNKIYIDTVRTFCSSSTVQPEKGVCLITALVLITSLLLCGSHSESTLAAQHENGKFPGMEQSVDLTS